MNTQVQKFNAEERQYLNWKQLSEIENELGLVWIFGGQGFDVALNRSESGTFMTLNVSIMPQASSLSSAGFHTATLH